jgi:two-component system, sensor histidine kinase
LPEPADADPKAPATEARYLPRPLNVLVAEDHSVNRQYIGTLLERAGHRVRFADNGAAAVAEAERELPDLVLMDVHMPVLDGLSATRTLRTKPAPLGQVKVIAVTADAFDATRERMLEAGADGHLVKPFRTPELDVLLLDLFGHRGPAPADAPLRLTSREDPPAMLPPAHSPGRTAKTPELLDLRTVSELSGLLSLDGVRPLMTGFFADDSRAYDTLLAGFARRDAGSLVTLAHRFKGAAQLLGLTALATHAEAIERHLGGWSPEEADAAAAELRKLWTASHTLCRRLQFVS